MKKENVFCYRSGRSANDSASCCCNSADLVCPSCGSLSVASCQEEDGDEAECDEVSVCGEAAEVLMDDAGRGERILGVKAAAFFRLPSQRSLAGFCSL